MENDKNNDNKEAAVKVAMIKELFSQLHDSDRTQATTLMQHLLSKTASGNGGSVDLTASPPSLSSSSKLESDISQSSESVVVRRKRGRPPSKRNEHKNSSTDIVSRDSVSVTSSDVSTDEKQVTNMSSTDSKNGVSNMMVLRRRTRGTLWPVKKRPYIQEETASDDDDDDDGGGGDDGEMEVDDVKHDPDYVKTKRSTVKESKSSRLKCVDNVHLTMLMACRLCRTEFLDEDGFKNHRCDPKVTSVTSDSVECKHCKLKFSSVSSLRSHSCQKNKSSGKSCKVVDCQHCGKRFSKQTLLSMHYKTHAKDGTFICIVCGEITATADLHEKHLMSHHRQHSEKKLCKICGTRFNNIERFESHIKRHVEFGCKICGGDFTSYRQLSLHCREKHGKKADKAKRHFCDVCGAGFPRLNHLEVHQRVHTGEKPVRCESCNMAFRTQKGLRRHCETNGHLRRTGQPVKTKTHLCSLCGRSYHRKQTLMTHQMYHTSDRPHKCQHCSFSSPDIHNLRRHMDLHFRNKKRFMCEICGASFHIKKTLESHHIYKHATTRPFPCTQCSLSFKAANALKRHMFIHGTERHHKCHCGAGFNRQYNLRRHLLTVHGSDSNLPPLRRVEVLDDPPKPPSVSANRQKIKKSTTKGRRNAPRYDEDQPLSVHIDQTGRPSVEGHTRPQLNVAPLVIPGIEDTTQVVPSQISGPSINHAIYTPLENVTGFTDVLAAAPLSSSIRTSMDQFTTDRGTTSDQVERYTIEHAVMSPVVTFLEQNTGASLAENARKQAEFAPQPVQFGPYSDQVVRAALDRTPLQSMEQSERSAVIEHLLEPSSVRYTENVRLPMQPQSVSTEYLSRHSVENDGRLALDRPHVELRNAVGHASMVPGDTSLRFPLEPVGRFSRASAEEVARIPTEYFTSRQPNRSSVELVEESATSSMEHVLRMPIEQSLRSVGEENRMRATEQLTRSEFMTDSAISAVEQSTLQDDNMQPVMIIDNGHSRMKPTMTSQVVATKFLPHIHSATLDPILLQQNATQLIPSQVPQMPIVMSTHINESSASSLTPAFPAQVYSSQLSLTGNAAIQRTALSPVHQPIILDIHTGFHEFAAAADIYIDQQTPVVIVPVSSICETDLIQTSGAIAALYGKPDSQLALDALNYRANPNYTPISMHQLHNVPN